MAEEEWAWREAQVIKTAETAGILSLNELVKLGWSFGLQRDANTGQNVLMWGWVDSEQNFIEDSRFESKVKREFEAICKNIEMNESIGQKISAVVKQFHGKFTWQYLEPVNDRPPMYFIKRDDCETKWQISEFVLWDLMGGGDRLFRDLKYIQNMPLDRLSEVPDLL